VPQQIGALDARLLRLRRVQRQAASGDQHRHRQDSRRFHADRLPPSEWKLISVPAEAV
jgi:hypothetical protein